MTKVYAEDVETLTMLIVEKEKDLELAARIGQALLQENVSLLARVDSLEGHLVDTEDRVIQIQHEMKMKEDLWKSLHSEDDSIEESDRASGSDDVFFGNLGSSNHDDLQNLANKCKYLEETNNQLTEEAARLRIETASVEEKEKQLVEDCVRQLAEANAQLKSLNNEVAIKGEENLKLQNDVTELMETSIALKAELKQIMFEHEQQQLMIRRYKESDTKLNSKVEDLKKKYAECSELLHDAQSESKDLQSQLSTLNNQAMFNATDLFRKRTDSMAVELKDNLNSFKLRSFPSESDIVNDMNDEVTQYRPLQDNDKDIFLKEQGGQRKMTDINEDAESNRSGFSRTSSFGESDSMNLLSKRKFYPEKLQIVKPMEGSQTLRQWQKLANFGLDGLNEEQDETSDKPSGLNLDIRPKGLEDFEGADIINTLFTDTSTREENSAKAPTLKTTISQPLLDRSTTIGHHSIATVSSSLNTISTISTPIQTSIANTMKGATNTSMLDLGDIKTNGQLNRTTTIPTFTKAKFADKSQTTMTFTYSNVSLNQTKKVEESPEQISIDNVANDQDRSSTEDRLGLGMNASPLVAFAKTIGVRHGIASPRIQEASGFNSISHVRTPIISSSPSNDSEIDDVIPKSSTPMSDKSIPPMTSIMLMRSNSVVKRNLSSLLLQPKRFP
ncbi:Trafficking kinesin-binding protein 1 [Trichoplax sp. H2]|nr:Trafficking kinesin-binding protein 1 [Trichoplax sp. H2]|eukprot:RDD37645.1 Trafficking kinesin-binding protein 1 [Trichoplax sp. H2]